MISIHAPRVGSDASAASVITQGADISIHAPRVGSDTVFQRPRDGAGQFQSTLPVWGATGINPDLVLADDSFQSTLPVWGATSIWPILWKTFSFQSTLPVWGATHN